MSTVIDAYKHAIISEIKSQNLYSLLAIASKDEESTQIFEELEKFEKEHEEKVTAIFRHKFPDEMLELDHAAIPGLKSREELKDPKRIYEYAISKEVDANQHYLKLAEMSEEQELKEVFIEMAAEEKKHMEILENEIRRIQDTMFSFDETGLKNLTED